MVEVVEQFGDAVFVGTTGKLSRELYEHRERTDGRTETDFYNVGAMGCAQSIGLGVSFGTTRDVVVLDGDGSVLMQMGAMATAGGEAGGNFHHVVFDNGVYGSTGGQPSAADVVAFEEVAAACSYDAYDVVRSRSEIGPAVRDLRDTDGAGLLVVRVDPGARDDLGRPNPPLSEYKRRFMDRLN